MDNNNYQVMDNNPQSGAYSQQGYANNVQPYNMGNMQPYNTGQPSVTYNVMNSQPLTESNLPEEFKPISSWGYIGYSLLFSIPLIGFIMLCVYAFGGTNKVNLRNYARSYFCILLLIIIGFAIMALTGGCAALLSGRQ